MACTKRLRWFLSPLTLGLLLSSACTRGPEIPEHSEAEPTARTAPSEEAPSRGEASPREEASAGAPRDPHAGLADPHAGLTDRPAARPASSFDPTAPALAGLRWSTQEPLTYRPPTRPMRNAEYFVAGDAGEAVLTVFHFPGMGGAVRDNINRWVGQFQTREGGPVDDADVQTKTVNGFEVTTVDVRGVFAGGMGSPRLDDARMLGAIVVGPEGPVFFKLVGPQATVSAAEGAFDALIESFEPASSPD